MTLGSEFHNPFHLRLDDRTYWISSSTLGRARILENAAKAIWRDTLEELAGYFVAVNTLNGYTQELVICDPLEVYEI